MAAQTETSRSPHVKDKDEEVVDPHETNKISLMLGAVGIAALVYFEKK